MKFNNLPVVKHFHDIDNMSSDAQYLAIERTLELFGRFTSDFLIGRIITVFAVYAMSGPTLAFTALCILFGLSYIQKYALIGLKEGVKNKSISPKEIESELVFHSILRFMLTGAVYVCFVIKGGNFSHAAGAFYIAAHCLIFISQSSLVPRAMFAGLITLIVSSLLGSVTEFISHNDFSPLGIVLFFGYAIFLIAERIIQLSQSGFLSEVKLASEVKSSLSHVEKFEIEKQQREKLETAAGVGLYNWYYEDNLHCWSKGTFLALGREESRGVPTREEFLDLLKPEDRDDYTECTRHARKTKTPFSIEFSIKGDDGNYRHIFLHGDSILDDKGDAIGLSGIIVDQTIMKTSLENANKARQVLQLALESAKAVVIEKDYKNGTIETFGNISSQLSLDKYAENGYTSHMLQEMIIKGLGEESQQIIDELIDNAEATGEIQSALHKYTFVNGDVIDAKTNVYVEGKPSEFNGRVIAVTTDVSEDIKRQRQLMTALVKETGAKSLLNMALTSGRSIILTTDTRGNIIEIFGDSSLFGIDANDDFETQSSKIRNATPREEAIKHIAARNALSQTHKAQIYEHKIILEDGTQLYLRVVLTLANGGSKRGSRYIAIATDITEEVARRDALTKALDEAKRASRVKSEFLANMSHEIRTPLNGVIAVASVLSGTKLDKDQYEMVKLVESSGETLKSLLNDILDLARVESGRLEIEQTNFNLKDALNASGALFKVKAEEKGIAFNTIIDEYVDTTYLGDPTRIKQVVSNLLSNAIKFTKSGGVTMKVKCNKPDKNKNSKITIDIIDTGMGISEENVQTLFERFEQVDGSITREHGGSGLGLAISKNLSKLMGGDISVSSKLGKGTKFTFTFCIKAIEENEEDIIATDDNDIIQNEDIIRVLAADDNETNRRILELILKPLGIELVLCENGKQALEQFKQQKFDVVLMDLQMPVMDGLSALEKMCAYQRANKIGHTPMIALSANAMSHHIEEAKKAGADLHIAKPFTPDGLIKGITNAIEKNNAANNTISSAAI